MTTHFKFGDRVTLNGYPDYVGTVVKLDHVNQVESMPNVTWDHLPDLACFYDEERLTLIKSKDSHE